MTVASITEAAVRESWKNVSCAASVTLGKGNIARAQKLPPAQ